MDGWGDRCTGVTAIKHYHANEVSTVLKKNHNLNKENLITSIVLPVSYSLKKNCNSVYF